jgi:hypothetical protein
MCKRSVCGGSLEVKGKGARTWVSSISEKKMDDLQPEKGSGRKRGNIKGPERWEVFDGSRRKRLRVASYDNKKQSRRWPAPPSEKNKTMHSLETDSPIQDNGARPGTPVPVPSCNKRRKREARS